MARGEWAAEPPAGRDHAEWGENEVALGEARVGDRKAASAPAPPAPRDDVEVEHPRSPAAAGAAAEVPFDRLQRPQHLGRREIARDQRDGIGEVAAGTAKCGVEDGGGHVEQVEAPLQFGDGGGNHVAGRAKPAVAAIAAKRDRIEGSIGWQDYPFVLSEVEGRCRALEERTPFD
jgi:hypothetical protein